MDAIPDQGRGNILGLGECIAIFWASAHRRSYEAVDSVEQHEKGCHMRSMIVSHLERRRPYSERNSVVLRIALSSISLQIRFHNASTIEGLIDKEALAAIQDDLCWEYKVLLAWSSVSAGLASFSVSETEIEGKDHFKCAASTCRRHETHHASPDTLLLLRRGW